MKSISKQLLLLGISAGYWIQSTNAFSMTIFGGPNVTPGSIVDVVWHDGQRNVNVMLAVQNKDNTLSPVGQTTFNVAPYGNSWITIDRSTPTGRNYYLIAEDMIDPSNYTTVGPFAVYAPFGDAHPTNSIQATATEKFLTDLPSTSSATSSGTIRSKSASSPTTSTTNSFNDAFENTSRAVLTVFQIVGIVIGCVAAVIIGTIFYVCCCRKRVKGTITVPAFPPAQTGLIPGRQPGMPNPMVTIAVDSPTVKKQSIKKPAAVKPTSSNTTVVDAMPSPKLQQDSPNSTNMSTDLYYNSMTNQTPPPTYYGGNNPYYGSQMYYGNQMQYPSQDAMPIPTHFNGPASPTSPSFVYAQQQPMYPPQTQPGVANYWNQPLPPINHSPNQPEHKPEEIPMTAATASTASSSTILAQKTELSAAPKTELAPAPKTEQPESSLAQKFEMPVMEASLEQYHDTSNLFQKPNTHIDT